MGRRFMLVVVVFAALLVWVSPAFAFSDVSNTDTYAEAIGDLSSRGIINGFDDGTFRPGELVTRQQFAKMIVLTLGLPATESDICPFSDVDVSGPGGLFPDNYVAVAAAQGITTGYPGGTFRPGDNISRAQVMSMVVRAAPLAGVSLSQPTSAYYADSRYSQRLFDDPNHGLNAQIAEVNGLLWGIGQDAVGVWDPWLSATRGEVAQVLANLLGVLAPSTGAHVEITSDASVILPAQGATYQFTAVVKDAAGRTLDQPVTWESSHPGQVGVSPSGQATAQAGLGSATITASSLGAEPAVGSVVVATLSPRTVLVQSSDVISSGSASAVLVLTDRTRTITVGDIVMSGSEGMLFGKVQSVQVTGSEVRLGIATTTLPEAFTDLRVSETGLTETTTFTSDGSKLAGRLSAFAADPEWQNLWLSGKAPQIRGDTKFWWEWVYDKDWRGLKEFKLAVHAVTSVEFQGGSIGLSVGKRIAGDWQILKTEANLSPFWIGPVQLGPEGTMTGGILGEVKAEAAGRVDLGWLKETVQSTSGFKWTRDQGLETIGDYPSPSTEFSLPTLSRASVSIRASSRISESRRVCLLTRPESSSWPAWISLSFSRTSMYPWGCGARWSRSRWGTRGRSGV